MNEIRQFLNNLFIRATVKNLLKKAKQEGINKISLSLDEKENLIIEKQ